MRRPLPRRPARRGAPPPARDHRGGRARRRPRALVDPTRLGLAAFLRDGGELLVCDLAWISGRAQNLVSHHLRALKREGLATSRREGKIVFYSLTEAGAELLENVLRPQFSATS